MRENDVEDEKIQLRCMWTMCVLFVSMHICFSFSARRMQSERFLSSWTNREDKLRFGNSGIRTDKENTGHRNNPQPPSVRKLPVPCDNVIVIVSIKVKNPFIFLTVLLKHPSKATNTKKILYLSQHRDRNPSMQISMLRSLVHQSTSCKAGWQPLNPTVTLDSGKRGLWRCSEGGPGLLALCVNGQYLPPSPVTALKRYMIYLWLLSCPDPFRPPAGRLGFWGPVSWCHMRTPSMSHAAL